MLSLFRKNLFINIILLLVFALGLQTYFLINPDLTRFTIAPIFEIPTLESNRFLILLTIVLIVAQALLISRMVTLHRLSRALSLIPGAVFILFISSILEPFAFHYILLANLFFVLSLGSLFKIYKKYKPISTLFNAGFFLGLATIIYFPYVIFIAAMLIGLYNLRSFNFKESLQVLIGFLSSIFLVGLLFYYFDNLELYQAYFFNSFSVPIIDLTDYISLTKPLLAIGTILILVGFQHVLRKKKKFDAIRKIELTYSLFLLAILSVFLTTELTEQHLVLISVPMSIIGGLVLESKDYLYIKEFIFLLLVGVFIVFQMQLL